jgi:F0F1-type ATP synthase assembly protein I
VPEPKSKPVDVSRYLSAGLVWALSTLMFLFGGSWVDGKLGSEPWFTLAGALVGASAGFWWMIRDLVIVPGRQGGVDRTDRGAGSEE